MLDTLSDILATLDNTLIETYRSDIRLFTELDQSQIDLGISSGGRPYSRFLRPNFFTQARYREIAHASEVLAEAFDAMTLAALENDDLMAELGLTEIEERYARVDPGYKGVCNSSRLDSFSAGREFKFLEYNGETPAGITDQVQIEKVLNKIPEVRKFLEEHPHWLPRPHIKLLAGLLSAYRDFGGKKEHPSIAIVDWDGVSTYPEFVVLKEFFESEGFPTIITDPGRLEYDGKTLCAEGIDIDIFYKRVLIHELFERASEDHPLLMAYADGNVCMANSFRTKIPHKKASLAVLANEKFASLFTSAQLEMIRKHIPWTRRLSHRRTRYNGAEIDLLEYVRTERHRFILKPNDDYGGSGIVIGWERTESEWDAAIDLALAEPFVVQERVAVEKVNFPTYDQEATLTELLIDFDPFLFCGKAEGGLVRLSSSSLVNVAAGGGETALVVLEDFV